MTEERLAAIRKSLLGLRTSLEKEHFSEEDREVEAEEQNEEKATDQERELQQIGLRERFEVEKSRKLLDALTKGKDIEIPEEQVSPSLREESQDAEERVDTKEKVAVGPRNPFSNPEPRSPPREETLNSKIYTSSGKRGDSDSAAYEEARMRKLKERVDLLLHQRASAESEMLALQREMHYLSMKPVSTNTEAENEFLHTLLESLCVQLSSKAEEAIKYFQAQATEYLQSMLDNYRGRVDEDIGKAQDQLREIKRMQETEIAINRRQAEVERMIEEAQQRVKILRQEVENERNKLEHEKEKMKVVEAKSKGRVKLNIGGRRFETSVDTLTQSVFFEAMFSGRYELDLDEAGAYFLDRDGELFKYILNYLRNGKVNVPADFVLLRDLKVEAEFFQMENMCEELEKLEASYESILHKPSSP